MSKNIGKNELWKLNSPSIIIGAIMIGYNKSDLLISKGKKHQVVNLMSQYSKGIVPQGTFNKYQKLLEKEKFIIHDETNVINRRKKETFQYKINTIKVIELIKLLFNKETEKELSKIISTIDELKKNKAYLYGAIRGHEKELKKLQNSLETKKVYDLLTETVKKVNSNIDEIIRLEDKIKQIQYDVKNIERMEILFNEYCQKVKLLKLTEKDLLESEDIEIINKSLKNIFYWKFIKSDTNFVLQDIVFQFIESLHKNKIKYVHFFGNYPEIPTANIEQDLTESLLKIHQFLKLRIDIEEICL